MGSKFSTITKLILYHSILYSQEIKNKDREENFSFIGIENAAV